MPNTTGIITLILAATEATETPFCWAVRAIRLKMAIKRKPSRTAPVNHWEEIIAETEMVSL